MSGQATGWVGRHGPRDRAQRLVLLAIADAANRDGEEAHPGMAAIVEFSLYSEGHCRRIIHELVDQGWLEQTGDPGPGVAAEFCIPGVNAAHHARSEDENTAHPDARGTPRTMRAEKPQRRANAAHTPRIQTRAVESASLFSPITSTSTKAPAPPPSSATRSPERFFSAIGGSNRPHDRPRTSSERGKSSTSSSRTAGPSPSSVPRSIKPRPSRPAASRLRSRASATTATASWT